MKKKIIFICSLFVLGACIIVIIIDLIWGRLIADAVKYTTIASRPVSGQIYTVQLHRAEVPAKFSDKSKWDMDGSAPDCYYQIWWRNNKIAESPIVYNSLLPSWGEKNNDISEILNTGKGTAKIKIDARDSIRIKIYDADPLKSDDLVLDSNIPIVNLLDGVNFITQDEVVFVLELKEYKGK